MTAPFILPAGSGRSPCVRPLAPGDLAAVAQLFQRTFRKGARRAAAPLPPYLGDLFFSHPWRDPDLPSRVHVSAGGAVDGFIGVFPLRMTFKGRPLRAAVAGSLMVEDPLKNPLAGVRLLRAFLSGPQDLSLSETANPLAQGLWTKLGGHVVPLSSMEWLRVLRPAGSALSLLGEVVPPARALWPLAALADFALARLKKNPFRLEGRVRGVRAEDAGEDAFIACAQRIASGFELRPDWDAEVLRWLLSHAAVKERHGGMVRRLVYASGPQPIGGYIYYVRPGGVAWVLQVVAQSGRVEPILDDLLAHALYRGAVALRGRTHPMLIGSLLSRGCLFVHRSSTLVHSRDAGLLAAARSDGAWITGLAGEAWARLIGGSFR